MESGVGQWLGRGWYSGAIEVSNLTAKENVFRVISTIVSSVVTYQLAFHLLFNNWVIVATLPQAKSMQWKTVMFGSMERERPWTNRNTIKEKIKQCIKGRTFSKVIGWGDGAGDEKKNYTQEKNCRRNKGNVKERKKEKKTCRLKIPHPRHNFSNATLLKTSASDDG